MSQPFLLGSEYQFSVDWFSKRIPALEEVFQAAPPSHLLEIGSYEGRSTCYFLETYGVGRDFAIVCVDTWEGGVEHDRAGMMSVEQRFDHNTAIALAKTAGRGRISKLKGHSGDVLCRLISADQGGVFDAVYIDGSHQAPDVLLDSVLSFKLVRTGGFMVFDDYLWCMEREGQQDLLNMPKIAIDAFTTIYQRKIRILGWHPFYQLYVQKLAD
jgi:predicted O-methyltransferase YrrM